MRTRDAATANPLQTELVATNLVFLAAALAAFARELWLTGFILLAAFTASNVYHGASQGCCLLPDMLCSGLALAAIMVLRLPTMAPAAMLPLALMGPLALHFWTDTAAGHTSLEYGRNHCWWHIVAGAWCTLALLAPAAPAAPPPGRSP